jgi:hypothetical protein
MQKTSPIIPVKSQINPIFYAIFFFRIHLKLDDHIRVGIANGLVHWGFPTRAMHAFLIVVIHTQLQTHAILLYLFLQITFGDLQTIEPLAL